MGREREREREIKRECAQAIFSHNLLFAARESFSRRELKKTLDIIFVLKKD